MEDLEIDHILARATEPLSDEARRRGRTAIEAALMQAATAPPQAGAPSTADLLREQQTVVVALPQRRSARRWVAVAGAAAMAAAAVIVVLLVRRDPEHVTVVGTDPTASVTPSATNDPNTSTLPTSPDVAPVTEPPPTITSNEPSSPTTAPTNVANLSHAMPAGLQLYSVSFPSALQGWAVGTNVETSARVFAHTADGGQSWTNTPVPAELAGNDGLFTVTFADVSNGWLAGAGDTGSGVWVSTHDGGTTWNTVTIAISGGVPTDLYAMSVSAANGFVHLIALESTSASNVIALYSSPVGKDAFTRSPLDIQPGAGPRFDASFAYGGGSGWMVYNDRIFTAAARLVNRSWSSWTTPCSDAQHPNDTALVAASADGASVVVACSTAQFGSAPFSARMYRSVDGGDSFTETTALPLGAQVGEQQPIPSVAFVDVPSADVILVGYVRVDGAVSIVRSADGGLTWTEVQHLPQESASFAYHVAAGSPGGGLVVVTGVDSGLVTVDGGLTWSAVTGTAIGGS